MGDSPPETHHRWVEHGGVRILELDLRGCSGEEADRRHAACSAFLKTLPEKSVLILTLARGTRYHPVHTRNMAGRLEENGRYVIASAIVGLEHLTKIVNVLNRLSGRSLRAFDDVGSAVDWLVSRESATHLPG